MVFLIMGRSAENIEEKKKTDGRKTLKSEEKEKRRIQGYLKHLQHTINIFGFTFYIKTLYFVRKHSLKKSSLYHQILLQFSCVAGYLKASNDTPKLNIRKYTYYNITERYINRLSTTTQIFIAMDCLILMSEKYLHFREKTKALKTKAFGKDIFGNISRIMCISKLKEIGIIQIVSKLTM